MTTGRGDLVVEGCELLLEGLEIGLAFGEGRFRRDEIGHRSGLCEQCGQALIGCSVLGLDAGKRDTFVHSVARDVREAQRVL